MESRSASAKKPTGIIYAAVGRNSSAESPFETHFPDFPVFQAQNCVDAAPSGEAGRAQKNSKKKFFAHCK